MRRRPEFLGSVLGILAVSGALVATGRRASTAQYDGSWFGPRRWQPKGVMNDFLFWAILSAFPHFQTPTLLSLDDDSSWCPN